jgi:S1-C subfamily serine protease
MKRAALYSGSQRGKGGARAPAEASPLPEELEEARPPGRMARLRARLGAFGHRHRVPLLTLAVLAISCIPVAVFWATLQLPAELSQEDIDDAVAHTWETKSLPSRSARAAEMVRQSVVRVRGVLDEEAAEAREAEKKAKDGKGSDDKGAKADGKDGKSGKSPSAAIPSEGPPAPGERPKARGRDLPKDQAKADPPKAPGKSAEKKGGKDSAKAEDKDGSHRERGTSIGSGVVIVDKGVILTNFHVVAGAKKLFVTFSDGMESEADLVGVFPDNDLAVLKARRIPDDLPAATLGSSRRLKPGDEVVAVGFPFDIGPSVSAGVVSGLNREFRAPKGERSLKNLIQFDAAANSGNSGGPLVTMDGEVVGIVTAILNPNGAGTFIGIGFAVTIEGAGAAVGIPPF